MAGCSSQGRSWASPASCASSTASGLSDTTVQFPRSLEGAVLGTSLSTYGWAWILMGAILLVSSFMVLTKSQFARWIGIIAGGLLAISAIWWMPFYPVWSLMYVFVGVLVVYGLAVYGGRDARP